MATKKLNSQYNFGMLSVFLFQKYNNNNIHHDSAHNWKAGKENFVFDANP